MAISLCLVLTHTVLEGLWGWAGCYGVEVSSWPCSLDQTGHFVQTLNRDLYRPEAISLSLSLALQSLSQSRISIRPISVTDNTVCLFSPYHSPPKHIIIILHFYLTSDFSLYLWSHFFVCALCLHYVKNTSGWDWVDGVTRLIITKLDMLAGIQGSKHPTQLGGRTDSVQPWDWDHLWMVLKQVLHMFCVCLGRLRCPPAVHFARICCSL